MGSERGEGGKKDPKAIQQASMALSVACARRHASEEAIEKAMAKAAAIWPEMADWRVARQQRWTGGREAALEDFDWARAKTLLDYLVSIRKGKLIKGAIARGHSPIGQAPARPSPKPGEPDLPPEDEASAAARWIVSLTDRTGWVGGRPAASQETLKLLLESAARDPRGGAAFLSALAKSCEPIMAAVWPSVEGLAGPTEAEAIRRLRGPFALLKKRGAIPEGAREIALAVERKGKDAEIAPEMAQDLLLEAKMPDSAQPRLAALDEAIKWDDDKLYEAAAPLAGLGEGQAKDLRRKEPSYAGPGHHRLMSSRAMGTRAWGILRLQLSRGADPWMIAQDMGLAAKESNPAMLFALSALPPRGEAPGEAERLALAARAFVSAMESKAEALNPGNGRSMAIESLRDAIARAPAASGARGIFAALIEEMQISDGLASGAPEPQEGAAPKRSRSL